MDKFETEIEDCKHCPYLKNNSDGEFYCFYDLFDSDVIDSRCPLFKDNDKKGEQYERR